MLVTLVKTITREDKTSDALIVYLNNYKMANIKYKSLNSYGYNNYNKSLNNLLQKKAEEFRKELIKKITNSEKKFRSYLDRNSIRYEFQKIVYIRDREGNIKKFYIPDFYLPQYKLLVEIDGDYHKSDTQKEYDLNKDIAIKRSYPNISILRIPNEKVADTSYIDGIFEGYKNTL